MRNQPIVLWRSKWIPDKVSIHGIGPTQEQQFNADIMKGWYAAEQKEGSRFNGGEFTKEQIKKAWSE
jgi:hypothetical protein